MGDFILIMTLNIDGNLVKPDKAERNQQYFCPGCEAMVIIKKGKKKTAHYAHEKSEICTQERIVRQAAKYQIKNIVNNRKNNRLQAPILVRECLACWGKVNQTLPDKVDVAEIDPCFSRNYNPDSSFSGNTQRLKASFSGLPSCAAASIFRKSVYFRN